MKIQSTTFNKIQDFETKPKKFNYIIKKEVKTFGPLSNKIEKKPANSTINSLKKLSMNFLENEKKLNKFTEKLIAGYTPNTNELLAIQKLTFDNIQKVELVSKLISSLMNTLKTLKQTQV
jgi:hypothetical protein